MVRSQSPASGPDGTRRDTEQLGGSRRPCHSPRFNLCRLGQVENVLREKQLLREFDSPFIVHSLGSFQDNTNLHLLLEFMAGGDMFQLLQLWGRLSLGPCRFYAAEVFLAMEYIHDRGYVYRDLKPENILIGASGHVKLSDLGFCKKVSRWERTYTTCGTPDYMAPEVLLCQVWPRL